MQNSTIASNSLRGGGFTSCLRQDICIEQLFNNHSTQHFTKHTKIFRSFSNINAFVPQAHHCDTKMQRSTGNVFIGFTLAEILITLGIIGVVAAMTLPALVGKYQEKQTITAVKAAYSIFSQASMRLVNEHGSFSALAKNPWETGNNNAALKENANITIEALSKYLKAFKRCDKAKGCMAEYYTTLDGSKKYNWDNYTNLQTGILANGMTFWILNNCGNGDTNETGCAQLGVDINGSKKPNIMGKDFFWFSITNNGKILIKSETDIDIMCNLNSTQTHNGYYCSSYILIHGNMNYLKN